MDSIPGTSKAPKKEENITVTFAEFRMWILVILWADETGNFLIWLTYFFL